MLLHISAKASHFTRMVISSSDMLAEQQEVQLRKHSAEQFGLIP